MEMWAEAANTAATTAAKVPAPQGSILGSSVDSGPSTAPSAVGISLIPAPPTEEPSAAALAASASRRMRYRSATSSMSANSIMSSKKATLVSSLIMEPAVSVAKATNFEATIGPSNSKEVTVETQPPAAYATEQSYPSSQQWSRVSERPPTPPVYASLAPKEPDSRDLDSNKPLKTIEEDNTADFTEEFDQAILPYESLRTKFGLHLVQLEEVEEEKMIEEPSCTSTEQKSVTSTAGTKATSCQSIISKQESTTSVEGAMKATSDTSIMSGASVTSSLKITPSTAATNLMAFQQDSNALVSSPPSATSVLSQNLSTTSLMSALEETATSDEVRADTKPTYY